MNAGEAILDQLLTEIARGRLHDGVKPLHATVSQCILKTGAYREWLAKFRPRKILRDFPDANHVAITNTKVLCLLIHAILEVEIGFRRVHKIEAEQIQSASGAD